MAQIQSKVKSFELENRLIDWINEIDSTEKNKFLKEILEMAKLWSIKKIQTKFLSENVYAY